MWQCKWRHLVAKLVTNASSAAWWPKLKSMESLTWIFFSTEFVFFSTGEMTSYRINTLGPLCLWQCLTLHPHFYCVSILCIWRLSQQWSISEISHLCNALGLDIILYSHFSAKSIFSVDLCLCCDTHFPWKSRQAYNKPGYTGEHTVQENKLV